MSTPCSTDLYVLQGEVFSGSSTVRAELGDDVHHSGEDTENRRYRHVDPDRQVVTETKSHVSSNGKQVPVSAYRAPPNVT